MDTGRQPNNDWFFEALKYFESVSYPEDRMTIHGQTSELFAALELAGFADKNTSRVVIDINVKDIVRVYVEKYTDSRMINVITTLTGIEITSITKDKE